YATTDSPFGTLLLAQTPRGLVRLGLPNQDADQLLVELARKVSPRVLEAPAELDQTRRELDLYFTGKLDRFDLPLDWQLSDGFSPRARRPTAKTPSGKPRNSPEMAKAAGNERAVRAAGPACGRNPLPVVVPCHRVLRSSGDLGGYGGGLPM